MNAVIVAAAFAAVVLPAARAEEVLRTPSLPPWMLVRRVEPEYPGAARRHRIEGVVRFAATIAKDGHIERLSLISGHPLLVRAAGAAARQWLYRPSLLRGRPVRVRTQIEVWFPPAVPRPSTRRVHDIR